ncbi:hypothetical protein MHSWG343_04310 [Candidatus Mycoplasma haematohominis]|uniref:Ribosomal processing cysteine protease Prp n=1 Tax=Candidatus Mycoplasma haematohominis TaxID=1494318 RepID=A0A478FR31_9MOLU|nr:hypothetical protein MHSWG343_04310 [Candidatus Mycoplasma haemohominis]
MIQIVARKDFLSVSGHAYAGTKGNDLVCAAVSVLVTGAAELWKNREEVFITKTVEKNKNLKKDANNEKNNLLREEKFTFLFRFRDSNLPLDLEYEYAFLRRYLRLVASQYPNNVSYSE